MAGSRNRGENNRVGGKKKSIGILAQCQFVNSLLIHAGLSLMRNVNIVCLCFVFLVFFSGKQGGRIIDGKYSGSIDLL